MGFPKYMKTKTNHGLKLISNVKHQNQIKGHEICKTKVKMEFYFDNA